MTLLLSPDGHFSYMYSELVREVLVVWGVFGLSFAPCEHSTAKSYFFSRLFSPTVVWSVATAIT